MVYIDDMMAPYGSMTMCHLLADTLEELHAMADKIGVQRKWYQGGKTGKPHYDVSLAKRKLAIMHGAIEITWRQAGKMMIGYREIGRLYTPAEAEEAHNARQERRMRLVQIRGSEA